MNSLSEVFESLGKKVPMLELPVWKSEMPFGGSVVVNPKFIESFMISRVSSSKATTWSLSQRIGRVTCRAILSLKSSREEILSLTISVG